MSQSLAFSPRLEEVLRQGDYTYVVTGATGWIGCATLEMLALALGERFSVKVQAYGGRGGVLKLTAGPVIEILPLATPAPRPSKPTILFHYAFLTKDKVVQLGDVHAYSKGNLEIREHTLRLASTMNLAGMVLASSGAVYDHIGHKAREADAGIYGQLKFQDEEIFADFCHRRGVPLIIPRIFNLSGPFINKFTSYALSSIIVDVLTGKAVKLTAAHAVYRSYVYVGDVIELAVRQLLASDSAKPVIYDTRGSDIVEIGDLARIICRVLARPDFAIDRPPVSDSKADNYLGSPQPWADILSRENYNLLPLRQQIEYTVRYINTCLATKGAEG